VAEASVRCGRAFAPAHVSGVFAPRLDARDPRARGSVGAGLVLEVGVTASAAWRPTGRASVRVSADTTVPLRISETVARRLLGSRSGSLAVRLEHALPIGQGFGSSAGGALATGLAVAEAVGVPPARAVQVAHLADLFGGGGLGGVAAILGGGLELRLEAGVPPFGHVVHLPLEGSVLVGTVGPPIRSPRLLGDPRWMRRFGAGERIVGELAARPSWEGYWDAAERFTDTVRLCSSDLRAVLRGLRRRGARAAQAMFGTSFFAAPPPGRAGEELLRWLEGRALHPRELALSERGAHTLPPPPASDGDPPGRSGARRPSPRRKPGP